MITGVHWGFIPGCPYLSLPAPPLPIGGELCSSSIMLFYYIYYSIYLIYRIGRDSRDRDERVVTSWHIFRPPVGTPRLLR